MFADFFLTLSLRCPPRLHQWDTFCPSGKKVSLEIKLSCNLKNEKSYGKEKSASVKRGQVKLREQKLKDGSSSMYLDINIGGKRHKEYMKLYQVFPSTPTGKRKKRQALAAANYVSLGYSYTHKHFNLGVRFRHAARRTQ